MAVEDPVVKDASDVASLSRASLADIARELPASTVHGVQRIVDAVRAHLDMDVAFVSEFVGQQRYFRHVDSKGRSPIKVGDAMPISDGYCQRVVDGRLPQLIADTARVPDALALPETTAVPIGSHLSVPIRLRSGHVYGTFCCFNFATDPTLNARDLHFLHAFAEVAAFQIDRDLEVGATRAEKTTRIAAAIARGQPSMVYQPMVALDSMRVVGVECLARFDAHLSRGPEAWFAEAAEIGEGPALELQAIRNALDGLRARGVPDDLGLWLNASAMTIVQGDLLDHLRGFDAGRIVLELTEHDVVADYATLGRALRPLRERGVRVAIDDAGAGYSSMAHILHIEPDYIKLDLTLTRHIDADRKRRALAAALIEFGRQTDCRVVAEAVESAAEMDALRHLGVQMAQGYHFGEPVAAARIGVEIARIDGRVGDPGGLRATGR